jgi:hypothetical protein
LNSPDYQQEDLERYLANCSLVGAEATQMPAFITPRAQCIGLKAGLFARDYPAAWKALGESPARLKSRFENTLAILSLGQLNFGAACCSSTIAEADCQKVSHFRQPRMGRTGVIGAPMGAHRILLECKGCGVTEAAIPTTRAYSSGLLSLECAVHEYLTSFIVDQITRQKPDWRFAHVYALLILDVKMAWGSDWIHAAILVREPTIRAPQSDLPRSRSREWEIAMETEIALRRVNLTSCISDPFWIKDVGGNLATSHAYRQKERSPIYLAGFLKGIGRSAPFVADRINIQVNLAWDDPAARRIVDFEHFKLAAPEAALPIINIVRDRGMLFGGFIPPELYSRIKTSEAHRQMLLEDWLLIPCSLRMYRLLKYAQRHGKQETFVYKQVIFSSYLQCCDDGEFAPLFDEIDSFSKRWASVGTSSFLTGC